MMRNINAAIAAGVSIVSMASTAHAEDKRYAVPAGSLKIALDSYARQSGRQIIYRSDDVVRGHTRGVTGPLSAQAALSAILMGTGFQAHEDTSGAVAIVREKRNYWKMSARLQAGDGREPLPPSTVTAEPADISVDTDSSSIVVTGSRVIRNGNEAPTPTTVLGTEELLATAPANIGDVVARLPAVVGSATPQNTNQNFSNGQSGIFAMNLRNLGTARTLVLLDGRRVAPSSFTGLVDVSTFPQGLVSRVDVVTGGASAAYGSDALSGVVNFAIDKKFKGIKGELSGGITTYGDDPNWKIGVTAGASFAGGRGHVLLSGELNYSYGIHGIDRAWNKTGRFILSNPAYTPTNGQPQYLLTSGAGTNNATPGGIITAGPLKGVMFGPGGSVSQFDYGTISTSSVSVGGSWRASDVAYSQSLDQEQGRQNIFGRVSYDFSKAFNVFFEGSYARATTHHWNTADFSLGNLSLSASNPFLPASVARRAAELGLTNLTVGSYWADLPPITFDGKRESMRFVLGADGKFDAFGTEWKWNAYNQYGRTFSDVRGSSFLLSRQNLAFDAVVNPATGAIVCRSTLTDPGNGCVPYNIFGVGVNSDAAIDYITGSGAASTINSTFTENVTAVAFNGDPFETWAGPVSFAFGAEHRIESAKSKVDAASLARDWYIGNYQPTQGSYNVTEGFVEVLVPLARDLPFARLLDFNAAVRATNYSTSGYVTTWKVGATYEPVAGLRFRLTRSRDIRAPNINELFAAGTGGLNVVNDRQMGSTVNFQTLTTGNPNLKPEKADQFGVGVVAQPQFLPGFYASVDYYNINVKDAVGSLGFQQIADNCYAGQTQYCAAVFRGANGFIERINIIPFNLARQISRGLDFEAGYSFDLSDLNSSWDGSLRIRGLATHYLKDYFDNGLTPPYDSVGNMQAYVGGRGAPSWIYQASITLSTAKFKGSVTGRGFSSGVYGIGNFATVACTSGCPTSTVTSPTISSNYVPGAFYVDLSGSYSLGPVDLFLSIRNLANKDPAILAAASGLPMLVQTNTTYYDIFGRTFRTGVRFKF